jgi:hypothetical protein
LSGAEQGRHQGIATYRIAVNSNGIVDFVSKHMNSATVSYRELARLVCASAPYDDVAVAFCIGIDNAIDKRAT